MSSLSLPSDPVMMLSVVNMQLRDKEPNLDMLAGKNGMTADEIKEKLASIGYTYDEERNMFV